MTLETASSLSLSLAEFAVAARELPERVQHAGRITTANALGLMIGAHGSDACRIAWEATAADELPSQATVLGAGQKTSVKVAALVGGIAAHLEDFDDTHIATVIHPGAPVVPAALAVGEHLGKTYGEVLEAIVLGVEVALRVGIALGPWHFDRGWHITGTTGRIGAAVASARLLGLEPSAVADAIGIAATEAAGFQAAFGTMTKPYHAGKSAFDGVEAAYLARAGFTSAALSLEGARGLFFTAARNASVDAALEGLGVRWEIEANMIKPYACGIVSHPVIDAGIGLRRQGLKSEAAQSIVLRTNPVVLDVMGKADPRNGLESKFSVFHSFAVGLTFGSGGPNEFSDLAAVNPGIVALRQMITVDLDPAISRDACVAEVTDTEGVVWREVIEHATASKDRPMAEEEVLEKMVRLATPVLGANRAREFAQFALRADPTTPVDELVARGSGAVGD